MQDNNRALGPVSPAHFALQCVFRAGRVRRVCAQSDPAGIGRLGQCLPVLGLVLLWWLILAPIAAWDVRTGSARATFDHNLFHVPTIRALAETWPIAKLTAPEHYVAMTPGYHWVLGGLVRLTGIGEAALRLVSLSLSALVFMVLGALLAARVGGWLAAGLIAPLLASMYVVNSGAWVLADNAGWAWVGFLSMAALYYKPGWRWSLLMGLGLFFAVWTRQNLLWLALPLWAAAWMSRPTESANPMRHVSLRLRGLAPMALATAPAIGVLLYVYSLWGGLVPYEFQGQYKGANASNIALQFVMLAGLVPFFLPALIGLGETDWKLRLRKCLTGSRAWMALVALLVMVVSVLTPTTHAPTQGRAGQVWDIADRLSPIGTFGHCNPLIVLAAGLGGALFVFVLACVDPRRRWILASIFVGFGVAQGASSEVWQRYHEPFALLFLALATVVACAGRSGVPVLRPKAQRAPLLALALMLAMLTAGALWQREIRPWQRGASPLSDDPRLPAPPPRTSLLPGITDPV